MDATNEDDAAMMAMMGMSGFGTTKVSICLGVPLRNVTIKCGLGQTCRGQSRRQRRRQEDANMASVHEPVCCPFS